MPRCTKRNERAGAARRGSSKIRWDEREREREQSSKKGRLGVQQWQRRKDYSFARKTRLEGGGQNVMVTTHY